MWFGGVVAFRAPTTARRRAKAKGLTLAELLTHEGEQLSEGQAPPERARVGVLLGAALSGHQALPVGIEEPHRQRLL